MSYLAYNFDFMEGAINGFGFHQHASVRLMGWDMLYMPMDLFDMLYESVYFMNVEHYTSIVLYENSCSAMIEIVTLNCNSYCG